MRDVMTDYEYFVVCDLCFAAGWLVTKEFMR